MKISILISSCLLITISLFPDVYGMTPDPKADRILRIISVMPEEEAKVYFDAFSVDTQIEVEGRYLTSGEALRELAQSWKKPDFTVLFAASEPELLEAKSRGYLRKYSPNDEGNLIDFIETDDFWTVFSLTGIGFVVNEEMLDTLGVPSPMKWEDLLNPRLKNNIALSSPNKSDAGYTVLSTLISLMGGKREAFSYWNELDSNIQKYNFLDSSCVVQTATFVTAVCISYVDELMNSIPMLKDVGFLTDDYLKLELPEEGTGYKINGAAIIARSKNKHLGERFVDWLLTKKAQSLMLKMNRIPVYTDLRKSLKNKGGQPIHMFDSGKFAKERNRIVREWTEEFEPWRK